MPPLSTSIDPGQMSESHVSIGPNGAQGRLFPGRDNSFLYLGFFRKNAAVHSFTRPFLPSAPPIIHSFIHSLSIPHDIAKQEPSFPQLLILRRPPIPPESMSEKKYSLLPTTVEEAEAAVPAPAYAEVAENEVAAATADRKRKMRLGFLKLSAITLLFYVLFWMPIDSEDDQGNERHRHGKHHAKKGGCHGKNKHGAADKSSFEGHWQADIDQLVAGSLESRYMLDRQIFIFFPTTAHDPFWEGIGSRQLISARSLIASSGIVWPR